MKAIVVGAFVVATFALVGSRALAQEVIPAPDPAGSAKTDGGAGVQAGQQTPPATDSSRGNPATYGVYGAPTPGYSGGYYYPYYAHPYYPSPYYPPYPYYRRYPGVAVGVGPYGDVGVGVGRRVGVNVWGPHGGVRVGRMYIGW